MAAVKRVLTEPLLHFLLLGAAIFVVSGLLARQEPNTQGEIIVTQAKIEGLGLKFARTWQRPPSEIELQGLITDYIREEAAVREAMALGIDRNDTVIRRLLRQRLEFVTEDVARLTEPSDAELNAYLDAHAEVFRTETHISFSHVFFDPQKRGAALSKDMTQLRRRLNETAGLHDAALHGDATLLEPQFTDLPFSVALQMFGQRFASALVTQTTGEWSGPIPSPYGEHLVHVSAITPGTLPDLEEIRDVVRREVLNERRERALDAFYTAILERYRVSIHKPPAKPEHDALVGIR